MITSRGVEVLLIDGRVDVAVQRKVLDVGRDLCPGDAPPHHPRDLLHAVVDGQPRQVSRRSEVDERLVHGLPHVRHGASSRTRAVHSASPSTSGLAGRCEARAHAGLAGGLEARAGEASLRLRVGERSSGIVQVGVNGVEEMVSELVEVCHSAQVEGNHAPLAVVRPDLTHHPHVRPHHPLGTRANHELALILINPHDGVDVACPVLEREGHACAGLFHVHDVGDDGDLLGVSPVNLDVLVLRVLRRIHDLLDRHGKHSLLRIALLSRSAASAS
mmetsp:Transcript_44258/g.139631  ORF Transcript_44258/g.139631 Transcript_44258/m.139631 type:complete len:274 (-) Transcript_44258:70-891(-)